MRDVSPAATRQVQSAQSEARNGSSDTIQTNRRRDRRVAARDVLRRAYLPVLAIEGLEGRTLLSTLPTPITSTATDVSGGGTSVNQSSPFIAYDPKNPQKLVTVFTSDVPNSGGTQTVFIGGRYSTNGGVSWQSFAVPNNVTNPTNSTAQDSFPYEEATDASVGFDLNDNFFVAYSQHS